MSCLNSEIDSSLVCRGVLVMESSPMGPGNGLFRPSLSEQTPRNLVRSFSGASMTIPPRQSTSIKYKGADVWFGQKTTPAHDSCSPLMSTPLISHEFNYTQSNTQNLPDYLEFVSNLSNSRKQVIPNSATTNPTADSENLPCDNPKPDEEECIPQGMFDEHGIPRNHPLGSMVLNDGAYPMDQDHPTGSEPSKSPVVTMDDSSLSGPNFGVTQTPKMGGYAGGMPQSSSSLLHPSNGIKVDVEVDETHMDSTLTKNRLEREGNFTAPSLPTGQFLHGEVGVDILPASPSLEKLNSVLLGSPTLAIGLGSVTHAVPSMADSGRSFSPQSDNPLSSNTAIHHEDIMDQEMTEASSLSIERTTRKNKSSQVMNAADQPGSPGPTNSSTATSSNTTSKRTNLNTRNAALQARRQKEEKEPKKLVAVKPSLAPVQELGQSYPDWSLLEAELAQAKTLENAYFLDASFLHALTIMDLWLNDEGPFFMPRREFRHRHCIFNLFWQPSAPNWEKSEYIVPAKLTGLLRWYLTRDNFINKESGNRLEDITSSLPQNVQNALVERGWGLYIMNMVLAPSNRLVFRIHNERGYQPYFGSTAKSQLKTTTLPELSPAALQELTRRLDVPQLMQRIQKLPDMKLGPLSPNDLAHVRTRLDQFKSHDLANIKKDIVSKNAPPTSSSSSGTPRPTSVPRKRKLDEVDDVEMPAATVSSPSPGTLRSSRGSSRDDHRRNRSSAASSDTTTDDLNSNSLPSSSKSISSSSRAGRDTTRTMQNLQQHIQSSSPPVSSDQFVSQPFISASQQHYQQRTDSPQSQLKSSSAALESPNNPSASIDAMDTAPLPSFAPTIVASPSSSISSPPQTRNGTYSSRAPRIQPSNETDISPSVKRRKGRSTPTDSSSQYQVTFKQEYHQYQDRSPVDHMAVSSPSEASSPNQPSVFGLQNTAHRPHEDVSEIIQFEERFMPALQEIHARANAMFQKMRSSDVQSNQPIAIRLSAMLEVLGDLNSDFDQICQIFDTSPIQSQMPAIKPEPNSAPGNQYPPLQHLQHQKGFGSFSQTPHAKEQKAYLNLKPQNTTNMIPNFASGSRNFMNQYSLQQQSIQQQQQQSIQQQSIQQQSIQQQPIQQQQPQQPQLVQQQTWQEQSSPAGYSQFHSVPSHGSVAPSPHIYNQDYSVHMNQPHLQPYAFFPAATNDRTAYSSVPTQNSADQGLPSMVLQSTSEASSTHSDRFLQRAWSVDYVTNPDNAEQYQHWKFQTGNNSLSSSSLPQFESSSSISNQSQIGNQNQMVNQNQANFQNAQTFPAHFGYHDDFHQAQVSLHHPQHFSSYSSDNQSNDTGNGMDNGADFKKNFWSS